MEVKSNMEANHNKEEANATSGADGNATQLGVDLLTGSSDCESNSLNWTNICNLFRL